jgi:hypothetical protein
VSGALLFGGIVLYGLNQTVLKDWLGWAFFRCYLNDGLAGVALVSYANLLCMAARREDLCLTTPAPITAFMLCVGLFWEFVTPLYRTDSIRDPLDLLAYVAGGMTYWAIAKGAALRPSSAHRWRPWRGHSQALTEVRRMRSECPRMDNR